MIVQKFFWEKGGVYWTKHSKAKIRQYQLSERQVLGVLRKPERKEEGVAPGTLAAMQTKGTKKHPKEIWIMYQIAKSKVPEGKHSASYGASKNQKHAPYRNKVSGAGSKVRVISAWRYPGKSPIGKLPAIPADVLEELEKWI